MAGHTKIDDRAFREKITVFEKLKKHYSAEKWFIQVENRTDKTEKQKDHDRKLKEAVGWINYAEDGTLLEMGRNSVGDHVSVGKLLESNATNDHVNKRGNTALHFAVRFGFDSIVNAILSAYPVEIERKNVLAHTPLWVALEEKNTKIAGSLMQRKAKNPIYYWLMTQGTSGSDVLNLIERYYDLSQVIKDDYNMIKSRGLLHDWRIKIAIPKLGNYCSNKDQDFLGPLFFQTICPDLSPNVGRGKKEANETVQGKKYNQMRFTGQIKLEEVLKHFNVLACHYTLLAEDIDFDSFVQLTEADMEKMQLRIGPKRKLLAAIDELQKNGARVLQAILKERK